MTTPDFSRCFGCGEPVVIDPVVTIYDAETRGYPIEAGRVTVALYHRYCLPPEAEEWYDVSAPHGHEASVRHIAAKRWCDPVTALRVEWALREVEAITRRYQEAMRLAATDRRLRDEADAPRRISVATRTHIMERDQFRCRRCGAVAPNVRLVVDHILPVSLGGGAGWYNLQTLCSECNAGKGAHKPTPHDLTITTAGLR